MTTPTTATLGSRLAQRRRELGLSQVELSREVGGSQSVVAKWETGARVPSVESLAELARVLDVSADWLLGIGGE